MLNYQERFYRELHKSNFCLEVSYRESDIYLSCDKPLDEKVVKSLIKKYYDDIASYIRSYPNFLTSLTPWEEDSFAPSIVKDMIAASKVSGIGPFSCVAGGISWYVGRDLLKYCNELILENGGDLFLKINEDKRVGIYLGESFSPNFITVKIKKKEFPFGIASSSSCFGHSLNFGRADLVTVIALDSLLADSFATAFSNKIKRIGDIKKVISEAKEYSFIKAVVVAFEGRIAVWGEVELDV